MRVISVVGGFHSANIVFLDGDKIYHYEEERYTRQKNGVNFHEHWWSFPKFAATHFLKTHNINSYNDIDFLVYNSDSNPPDKRAILSVLGFSEPIPAEKLIEVGHYNSHASCAYYLSGFSEPTLIIAVDGYGVTVGDIARNAEYYLGEDGNLSLLGFNDACNASFGGYYSRLTEFLGFKCLKDEGKVTGMAPHGEYIDDLYKYCNEAFQVEGIHTSQTPSENFVIELIKWYTAFYGTWRGDTQSCRVAYNGQKVFEEKVIQLIKNVHQLAPHTKKLALAGGIFANVALNKRINELDEFSEIFIAPAMGDEGLGIGNVLTVANIKPKQLENVYFGSIPKKEEERQFLTTDLHYEPYFPEKVATLLANDKVIGLFQGASESGPRALGNRSIIANPTSDSVVARLTKSLRRFKFMPFAPTVLKDRANEVFCFEKSTYTGEFMTLCYDTRPEWRDKIKAVLHPVDRTARPQALRKETNPVFYDIIFEFDKITGVPLVLNTSFNVHDEPIIDNLEQAIRHLKDGVVDCLVYPPFMITK